MLHMFLDEVMKFEGKVSLVLGVGFKERFGSR